MSKRAFLAFAALFASLGLYGCGGGSVEETAGIANSTASDTIPPSAPAGLTATATSPSQVALSWTAATDNVAAASNSGVAGYRVYRNGLQIATLGADTTFQDTGLTPSTTYSYAVRAFDAAGNVSGPSSSASATTPATADTTAPSTPAGLTAAAASSSQINLSWAAATDNVGVAGYNVYRGGIQIATLGAVTTYQNTGLAASTSYSYTVQAFDAAGNASSQSAAASATTPATPDTTAPSTPAGLTATAASSSQINLSWAAATDNVGVTGYNVYRGGTQIATLGAVTTYQNTGLTPSTTYSYAVRAFDAAGNVSTPSSSASATTQAAPDTTAPSTPTGLNATAVSSSQINLSWAAATDNVGVAGYNVYRGGTQIATLGAVTTFQNTGLTPSTTYSYTVRALDAAGNISAPSSSAVVATQAPAPDTTAPSTPAGLTAAAASSSQINLSWAAATDNVGVAGYNVYRGGIQIATLGAVTTYQNTGLAASTSYSYTVQAFDAAGNASSQSAAASATTPATPDTTAPSTPAGLTATAASSSQINLSWAAATDNVGVTGYNVYRGGTQIATLGAVTTYQNTGLTPSTTYSYAVRAFDAAGNVSTPSSSASATTQAAPDTTAPSTPTGLNATAVSSSQINLSWAAATDNVGVAGYNVYRGGTQIATLGAVTTFQNTGLTPSTTYSYTVRALDAAGNISAPSSSAIVATQAAPDTTAPSTPAGLTAAAASSSQINLSWAAATDNVGVAGYNVYRGGIQIATLGAVTTYQNTGLAASTSYSYTVQAFDAAGNASSQSATANATTPASSNVISLALVPSRTSGVAPLAVFFDATGTTSPLSSRPVHELEYRWDFGDRDGSTGALNKSPPNTGATTWATGSRGGDALNLRNSATGPVAAHVYETPGTYTVALTAFDGTNTDTTTVTITVDNPDDFFAAANTVCVSTTSGGTSFDGCPAGGMQVTSTNLGSLIATHAVGGKRLLFRRGQTWSSSSPVAILSNSSTARTIGSFGPGATTAKLSSTQTSFDSFIGLSHPSTPNFSDVRIMDLEIEAGGRNVDLIGAGGRATRITLLRLNLHNAGSNGIVFSEFVASGQGAHFSEIAVVDSTIANTGAYNSYFAANKSAWLGNTLGNSGAPGQIGVWRTQYFTKSVMSNNTISGSPQGFNLVKFGAGKNVDDGTGRPAFYVGVPTEFTILSDNLFDDRNGHGGWMVAMGPENPNQNEEVKNCIVERNWFRAAVDGGANNGTEVALKLWAHDITARNNLIDMSNGHEGTNDQVRAIHVDRRGAEVVPHHNEIYNNTIYRSDSMTNPAFSAIALSLGTNMVVRNNLGYTPNISNSTVLLNSATGTVASNNSTNAQQQSTSPNFTTNPPTAPAHYKPTSGYAIGGGSTSPKAPVWSDFFRVPTPSTPDIGAVNH